MRRLSDSRARVGSHERAQRREVAEHLWRRAQLLCERDEVLLTAYLENGQSFRRLAHLTGLRPTTIARRVHRIMERLADETYTLCRAGHDDFTRRELAVIRDYFVRGLSMTRVSAQNNVSYYGVRVTVQKARAYVASMKDRAAAARMRDKDAVTHNQR
jgi:hypothetical protein